MAPSDFQCRSRQQQRSHQVWALVQVQHGVVSRTQLLDLGFTPDAIRHRLEAGRLFPVFRGVYAVGRPEVSPNGRRAAALLAAGPGSVLSGRRAAAVWGLREAGAGPIELTLPPSRRRRIAGISSRRAEIADADAVTRVGLRVTSVARTLLDLAPVLTLAQLEAHINTADKLDLIDPERLRQAAEAYAGLRGSKRLRGLLDRRSFVMTDSDLERRFLPIADRAGLPRPLTRLRVNGYLIDFYWPDLGLVVETDGLRYHRTAAAPASHHSRPDQSGNARG